MPLFVGQYFVGQSLYNNPPGSNGTRTLHSALAMGISGLFAVNTVTGVWNLWESRRDDEGRARRYIHAALMLTADAGFAYSALQSPNRRSVPGRLTDHRNVALISMGLSLTSYGMMLIWK